MLFHITLLYVYLYLFNIKCKLNHYLIYSLEQFSMTDSAVIIVLAL